MSISGMLKEVGLTPEAVRRIAERNRDVVQGMEDVPGGVVEDGEFEMESDDSLADAIYGDRDPYCGAGDAALAEDLRYHGTWKGDGYRAD